MDENEFAFGNCKTCGNPLSSRKQKHCKQECSETYHKNKKEFKNRFPCNICLVYGFHHIRKVEFKIKHVITGEKAYLCKLHKKEIKTFLDLVLPNAKLKIKSFTGLRKQKIMDVKK